LKINLKDLQFAYIASLSKKIPISRKSCPSLKKLKTFFTPKTSEKQKTNIIDHVTNCYFCAQEFQLIYYILRYEKKLNRELYSLLYSKNEIRGIKKTIKKSVSKSAKTQKYFQPFFNWKYAFLLFGTVILVLTLTILKNENNGEYRTNDFKRIHLVEPLNEKHSKFSLLFKWDEFKGSNYYVLDLFDETLLPIWRSKKIFKDFISLPKEVVESLDKNKNYYWMITAFLPNGKKIESNIEGFKLID
jgi:hypothetical protein